MSRDTIIVKSPGPKGDRGARGRAATIEFGSIEFTDSLDQPQIENTGTDYDATINLKIPYKSVEASYSFSTSEDVQAGDFVTTSNKDSQVELKLAQPDIDKFFGFCLNDAKAGETVRLKFRGTNDMLSNLIPGETYYIGKFGKVSLNNKSGQMAGVAISATTLIV